MIEMQPSKRHICRVVSLCAVWWSLLTPSAGWAEIRLLAEYSPQAESAELTQEIRAALLRISPRAAAPDVRIAVGASAFRQALNDSEAQPLIAVALTSTEFDAALGGRPSPSNVTAVFSNPDPLDQIALARELLGRSAIGIVDSPAVHPRLARVVDRRIDRISFSPEQGTDGLLRAVDALDVIVVLPDPLVLNQSNISHVVRALYQRRKVLIGYSATLSRVGSLASVYVPSQAITQKVVDMVERLATGGVLPAPAFVRDVDVAVNDQLAHSLSIPLSGREELLTAIRAQRDKAPRP